LLEVFTKIEVWKSVRQEQSDEVSKKITNGHKFKIRIIVIFKFFLYLFSLFIAFGNFFIFLIVFLMLNTPIIRKSIFGRLPTDSKEFRKRNVIKYRETFEYLPGLLLDIFYPSSLESMNRTQSIKGVVLFAHGGGWISGYRRQPNNVSWYRYLVNKGFIVATIDYERGYKAGIEKLISELIVALNFLKGHLSSRFGFERKISLMGLSAGGHLALLAASRIPEEVDSVVAYYSPCDLLDIWNSTSLFARLSAATTLKRLPYIDRSVYERYSPINNISPVFPRTLLVHGLKDSVVPYISSLKMFKKLKELNVKTKLLLHPKGEHGFEFVLRDSKTVDIIEKTAKFLEGELW